MFLLKRVEILFKETSSIKGNKNAQARWKNIKIEKTSKIANKVKLTFKRKKREKWEQKK